LATCGRIAVKILVAVKRVADPDNLNKIKLSAQAVPELVKELKAQT
jgi:hypothetical protein